MNRIIDNFVTYLDQMPNRNKIPLNNGHTKISFIVVNTVKKWIFIRKAKISLNMQSNLRLISKIVQYSIETGGYLNSIE